MSKKINLKDAMRLTDTLVEEVSGNQVVGNDSVEAVEPKRKKGKPSTIYQDFEDHSKPGCKNRVVYNCADYWDEKVTKLVYPISPEGFSVEKPKTIKTIPVKAITLNPPRPNKKHPDAELVKAREAYSQPTNAKELFALMVRARGYRYM